MSGRAPKRKGDGYERELAKYFNKIVFGDEDLVPGEDVAEGTTQR